MDIMGVGMSTTSAEGYTSAASCDFRPPREVMNACHEKCKKDDSREIRDLHEFKAVQFVEKEMSGSQKQQAQQVVNATLQSLLLGLQVTSSSRPGGQHEEGRFRVTEDLKAVELETVGVAGARQLRRAPLSECADTSFGGDKRVLVLRFTEALGKSPMEIGFASEKVRVSVALTLKVLRTRQQQT